MTLRTALYLCFLLLITACSGQVQLPQAEEQAARAAEQEISGHDLEQMMEVIEQLDLPVDAVVVQQDGAIVFEGYPNPAYGPDELHILYSTTKSITSALIGIAIEEGYIEGVDQEVVDFFPDWDIEHLDTRKKSLTIEHLLTMSCGFAWEGPDDHLHTWGDAVRSRHPAQYVLNLPMASDPGTEWEYNGGCSHLLSAILTESSGRSTLAFARKYLFEPLGITKVKWPVDPQGIYYGGQDIWLTPRDMAKIGQLYLDGGRWEGEQIIPAEWVAESAETRFTHWDGGYGYQWWTFPESGIYYASGAYEQRIYVIPDLDMVVVFTADNKAPGLAQGEMRSGPPVVDWLLGRFILPAASTNSHLVYDDYGFTVDIPLGAQVQVHGKSWQGNASGHSGLVQILFGSSVFEQAGVQWEEVNQEPELTAVLEEFIDVLNGMGLETRVQEMPAATKIDGREWVQQVVEINDGQHTFSSVLGTTFCEENKRVYLLYYANMTELADLIDPQLQFQAYAESFQCFQ